ncbi:MAG: cell wall hydrolase [Clostridiales bacterium GWC2_40_7]|nr:MAG: cell wall hydrolase [Clostridiales bacterium GWC2_40_7]
MIVVVKKNNIILVGLIFILLATIYSLNLDTERVISTTVAENQKTVIIDAGHGGEDPGKVSNYSDLREKDLNLIIAQKTRELLEKENFTVIMTRQEDRLEYAEGTTNVIEKRRQDLNRRKKIMDESGAAIVVSIHLNGFNQTQYYGAQTFYPPNSEDSKKLAEVLQKSIRDTCDPENKREPQLKKDPIIILADLKTPTVIVECGFLSNAEEEKKLGTAEYQDKLAAAITLGIQEYFK